MSLREFQEVFDTARETGEFFAHLTITPDQYTSLLSLIRIGALKNLQSLHFGGCNRLAAESVVALADTAKAEGQPLQSLRSVDFGRCHQIAPESVLAIAEAARAETQPLKNLLSLVFASCNRLAPESVVALAEAAKAERQPLRNLQSLNFIDCKQLTSGSMVALAEAVNAEEQPLINLHSLNFRGCELLDMEGIGALATAWAAGRLPKLERVDFGRTAAAKEMESQFWYGSPELVFATLLEGRRGELRFHKAVLLGETRVSTTWFRQVVFERKEPDALTTHAWEVVSAGWRCSHQPRLNCVDLAGERALHGMHRAFLRGTNLAIVVLNRGWTPEQNLVEYWPRFLEHCLPNREGTLVVVTQADQKVDRLGNVDPQRVAGITGGKVDIIPRFSSRLPKDGPEAIARTIDDLLDSVPPIPTPAGVDKLLCLVGEKLKSRAMAPIEEYDEWCIEAGIDTKIQRELLGVLRDMGELLYFWPTSRERSFSDKSEGEDFWRGDHSHGVPFELEMLHEASRDTERYEELSQWVISREWLTQPLYEVMRIAWDVAKNQTKRRGFIGDSELKEIIQQGNKKLDVALGPAEATQLRILMKVLEITRVVVRDSTRNGYWTPAAQQVMPRPDFARSVKPTLSATWRFFDEYAWHRAMVGWFSKIERDDEVPYFWSTGIVLRDRDSWRALVSADPVACRVEFYFEAESKPEEVRYTCGWLLRDLERQLGKPESIMRQPEALPPPSDPLGSIELVDHSKAVFAQTDPGKSASSSVGARAQNELNPCPPSIEVNTLALRVIYNGASFDLKGVEHVRMIEVLLRAKPNEWTAMSREGFTKASRTFKELPKEISDQIERSPDGYRFKFRISAG